MENYLVFKSEGFFYDDVNFPYGFDRSGVFNRTEAEILNTCGKTLKALADGTQPPMGEDQLRFVAVCKGEVEPVSTVEKAWIRYLEASSNKGRPMACYFNHQLDSKRDSFDDY